MLQQLAGGETVRAHLDSGAPLPTLQIMRELLETVTDMEDTSSSAGHESEFSELGGLVYHDLKPENVTYDPDTGDTYLLDGGIALGSLETGSNPATVRGTSIWMAPEQCRGAHNLLQTNQYQLALIWLELRTKGGYSNMRYEMNHERRIYTYAYQTESDLHWEGINKLMMDHDIPYEEQRIMLRALQNDPTKRWESTGAMLDAYLEYTSQLALFTPRPSETPAFRHVRLVAADTADMQTLPLALVRRDPVSAPVR
jgi:serine/threonine protein kinase